MVERQSLHRPHLTKSRVRKHGLSLQERSGSACYALHHHMAVLAIFRILWCRIDKSFKTSRWTVHPQAGQSSNVSDRHLRHKPSDHRPSFSCTTSPLPPSRTAARHGKRKYTYLHTLFHVRIVHTSLCIVRHLLGWTYCFYLQLRGQPIYVIWVSSHENSLLAIMVSTSLCRPACWHAPATTHPR